MPVVVVSAVDDIVFDALNAGAVDFVSKPNRVDPNGVQSLVNELAVKIKIASISKVGHWKHRQSKNDPKGRVMASKKRMLLQLAHLRVEQKQFIMLLNSFLEISPVQ